MIAAEAVRVQALQPTVIRRQCFLVQRNYCDKQPLDEVHDESRSLQRSRSATTVLNGRSSSSGRGKKTQSYPGFKWRDFTAALVRRFNRLRATAFLAVFLLTTTVERVGWSAARANQ